MDIIVETTVLSINANNSMNLVLKNIFSKASFFYLTSNVYSGFSLLKCHKEINLIIIDFDEGCKDCLDFIYFVNSSKIYKRKILILAAKHQMITLSVLEHSENVQVLLKPFNPTVLQSYNYESLNYLVIEPNI
jgi:hypothetical protein